MDLSQLFQILQNAQVQAEESSPFRPLQTAASSIGNLAIQSSAGQKPKDAIVAGLLSGLVGGGAEYLTRGYADKQTGMARDVLSEAISGRVLERPSGMNPSVFRSVQNAGSLFGEGQRLDKFNKEQDAARQIRTSFAREGIQVGEGGELIENPAFRSIMDDRANTDADRMLGRQLTLQGSAQQDRLELQRMAQQDRLISSPLAQSALSKLTLAALTGEDPKFTEQEAGALSTDMELQRAANTLISQINIGGRADDRMQNLDLKAEEGIYTEANKLAESIPSIKKAREVLPELDKMEVLLERDLGTAKELFDTNLLSTIGGRGGKLTEQGLQRLKDNNIITDVNLYIKYWTADPGTIDTQAQKEALRAMLNDMRLAYTQGAEKGFQEVESVISRKYGRRLERNPELRPDVSAFIQQDLGSSFRNPERSAAQPAQQGYSAQELIDAGYSDADIQQLSQQGLVR